MMTRHTVMVVGPTGGGKSVVIHTLAQAQVNSIWLLFCPVFVVVIVDFVVFVVVFVVVFHYRPCRYCQQSLRCRFQTRLGLTTKLYTINPKATSVIELYGILDPATRDWIDGLLSNIFREINKPTGRELSDRRSRLHIVVDNLLVDIIHWITY